MAEAAANLKESLIHALPKLPSPNDKAERRASSTRTSQFSPSLPTDNSKLVISCSRRLLSNAAVSFPPCGLVSTSYEADPSTPDVATVIMRLSLVDPSAHESVLAPEATRACWSALWCYVAAGAGGSAPRVIEVELPLPSTVLGNALLALGAVELHPRYRILRSALWEMFGFANSRVVPIPFPYVSATTNGIDHPLRPPKPTGTIYSRHVPHLEEYFKLDTCTSAKPDVDTVHAFMNEPRVDAFWAEKGTWEAHEKFVQGREQDPHVLSVLGSYLPVKSVGSAADVKAVEERAVYSEIYWVKEDAVSPLMSKEGLQVKDYDRGIHVLVGSNSHRGAHRIRAWLPSLVHYCFMNDARTERIIAEPNEKNAKMISYFESVGFVRHGSVTFPHKVSALMICERRTFYDKCPF